MSSPRGLALVMAAALATTPVPNRPGLDTVLLRGRPQTVRLFGERGSGPPVIVSSGDGGWLSLAPRVAETLAAHGYFVVGFDTKAYLESFTPRLNADDVVADYQTLAHYTAQKPILVGVSEGAGLSVLAASDAQSKSAVAGVLALGLPQENELAWRLRDSIIYVTHRVPDEPTFNTSDFVGRVAPLPLAEIHSTHDEFVPLAEEHRILASAHDPTKQWIVDASNHRFSDGASGFDRALFDALDWIRQNQATNRLSD